MGFKIDWSICTSKAVLLLGIVLLTEILSLSVVECRSHKLFSGLNESHKKSSLENNSFNNLNSTSSDSPNFNAANLNSTDEFEYYIYFPLGIVNGSLAIVGNATVFKANPTIHHRSKRQIGLNTADALLGGALGGALGGLVGGTVGGTAGPVGAAAGGGLGAGIGAAIGAGFGGGGPGGFLLGGAGGAIGGTVGGLLLGGTGSTVLGLVGGAVGGALGSLG